MRSLSAPRFPSPATVVSLLALFVSMGGTAYAATGGTFILGQANSATTVTRLTSTAAGGAALKITNTGGKPAARFVSNAGIAPFQVSGATKVVNLNADKLDDLDATAFMLGTGSARGAAMALSPGQNTWFASFPMMDLGYLCPDPNSTGGTLYLGNMTAETLNVFSDSGATNPLYEQILAGNATTRTTVAAADAYTIQVQGSAGILVMQVATAHRVGDCHVQAQGVFTAN